MQGVFLTLAYLANIFAVNLYFLIPGILNICVVYVFIYCKDAIIAIKELELKLKTPVFTMVEEILAGLTQIKIFGQTLYFLKKFASRINESAQGTICFSNLLRAFGVITSYTSIVVLWIGLFLGVLIVTPENAGLCGVSLVFLATINDSLQMALNQIIIL